MKNWELIADNVSKPLGVWTGSPPSIAKDEQSGLLTHIATTERFVVRAEEKLTAFLGLAAAVHADSQ